MVLGHGIRGKGWCDEKIQVWYVKLYARKWYLTLFIARGLSGSILPSSSNLIPKGVPIFSTFFSVHTNWQMNLQVQAQNLLFLIPKGCEFWFSLHSASSLGVCMCVHVRAWSCVCYVCVYAHACTCAFVCPARFFPSSSQNMRFRGSENKTHYGWMDRTRGRWTDRQLDGPTDKQTLI